jgi:hypothetical protein
MSHDKNTHEKEEEQGKRRCPGSTRRRWTRTQLSCGRRRVRSRVITGGGGGGGDGSGGRGGASSSGSG